MKSPLTILAGQTALTRLRDTGWHGSLFDTVVGASGGPKWLILSELDQVLAQTLLAQVHSPLTLLGSSIGTWRHACLSLPDPVAAIKRLQHAYLYQRYRNARPSPREVSEVAEAMLNDALGDRGPALLAAHPHFRNAVVTARARGIARGQRTAPLVAGMGLALLANAMHRKGLEQFFQRVVFCHPDLHTIPFAEGFDTQTVPLSSTNVVPALKASGAIPMLMQCEPEISGAPPGPYWDGGIIDYHFSLAEPDEGGLILYPHFRDRLTPGWFDKSLRWRAHQPPRSDRLILMCPSDEFLASLPFGKIPDRGDFRALSPEHRIAYWEVCVRESKRLAEYFHELVTGDDPLRGVTPLS